jgi:hypothetical protein
MANWKEIEDKLSDLLSDGYYRGYLATSPREHAKTCVQKARGNKLSTFSGDINVVELKHPARAVFLAAWYEGLTVPIMSQCMAHGG